MQCTPGTVWPTNQQIHLSDSFPHTVLSRQNIQEFSNLSLQMKNMFITYNQRMATARKKSHKPEPRELETAE